MALSPSGSWSNGKSRRLTLSWTAHSARSACRDYDGFRVPGARWFGYLLLNLVALCIACNLIKNTNSFADFCAMAFAIDARFPNVPITTELPVTKFASGLGASHRTPSCDLDKESLLAPALAKLYSEKKAPCYLCGVHGTVGTDRVDSDKSYRARTKPCSARCNIAKMDFELRAFIGHIRRIAAFPLWAFPSLGVSLFV